MGILLSVAWSSVAERGRLLHLPRAQWPLLPFVLLVGFCRFLRFLFFLELFGVVEPDGGDEVGDDFSMLSIG